MGTKRSHHAHSQAPPLLTPESHDSDAELGAGQASKYIHVDDQLQRLDASSSSTMMLCSLPPHGHTLTFPTYESYDVHYMKAHANRCAACGKNFPSEHLLGLHIAENHDPLNDARKARGEKIVGALTLQSGPGDEA